VQSSPASLLPPAVADPLGARLPGLDAVRALAIAAVLAYHLNVPGLFNAGFLGVDVFFALSGFLITSLLLGEYVRQGQIDMWRYYWRRAVRLVPAVIALLLLSVALAPWLMPGAVRRLHADLPWSASYLANWWQICSAQSYFENFGQAPLLRHLWSLGVEMQFYLLWPWLVLMLLRVGGVGAVLGVSLLLALASSGWMAWLAALHADNPSRAYLGSDSHSMGLFMGAAMACLSSPLHSASLLPRGLGRGRSLVTGALAGAVLLALMCWLNEAQALLYQFGFLATALASVALLASCAPLGVGQAQPWPWRLGAPALQWLGTRSYSVYLWHWPVFIYFKGDSTPSLWVVAQCLAWTALLSELSFRWVETALAFTTRRYSRQWQRRAGRLALVVLLLGGGWVMVRQPCPATTIVPASGAPAPTPNGVAMVATPPVSTSPGAAAALPTPMMAADSSVLAIGDSVMLGARHRLLQSLPGVTVDAEVGRQMRQSLTLMQRYLAQRSDLHRVVIHIGTNGYIVRADLRRLLGELNTLDRVVLVNNHADRRWTEANNQIIEQVAAEFGNVRVLDWHARASANPQFFVTDGVHLTSEGITAFVHALAASLDMALAPAPGVRQPLPNARLSRSAQSAASRPGATGLAQPASAVLRSEASLVAPLGTLTQAAGLPADKPAVQGDMTDAGVAAAAAVDAAPARPENPE